MSDLVTGLLLELNKTNTAAGYSSLVVGIVFGE
jgi:hypothetical protein